MLNRHVGLANASLFAEAASLLILSGQIDLLTDLIKFDMNVMPQKTIAHLFILTSRSQYPLLRYVLWRCDNSHKLKIRLILDLSSGNK